MTRTPPGKNLDGPLRRKYQKFVRIVSDPPHATRARSNPNTPRWTTTRLRELLALTRAADSVELKLTVSEEHRYSTLTALGIDPLDAYIRQIFFFDTKDLALDKAGVVARARRSQGRPDDSVVKLRPVEPSTLEAHDRKSKDFVVEVDAMPGGYVCSASYKGTLEKPRVKERDRGRAAASQAVLEAAAGVLRGRTRRRVSSSTTSLVLGPGHTSSSSRRGRRAQRQKLAVELWNYPDGTRILELSTKCPPADAFDVAAEGEGVSRAASEWSSATRSRRRRGPRSSTSRRPRPAWGGAQACGSAPRFSRACRETPGVHRSA